MSNKLTLLQALAKELPTSSGCYLMKNKAGETLYVGKAKNLRSRVGSYFNRSDKSAKTEALVSHIESFDFILTVNEAEALVLENTLIKKFRPKYNILLRDDKSYPYVFIDLETPFPSVNVGRNIKAKKGRLIFGPFPTGFNIKEIVSIVSKVLKLRDCTLRDFSSRKRVCLLYEIEQCSGSCVGKIDKLSYESDLKRAIDFFSGREQNLILFVESLMKRASVEENFEKAIYYRDYLNKLQEFVSSEKNRFADFGSSHKNFDLISFESAEDESDLVVTSVRQGLLIGNRSFSLPYDERELLEAIPTMLFEFYKSNEVNLPREVFINLPEEELEALSKAQSLKFHRIPKTLIGLYELGLEQALQNRRLRAEKKDHVFLANKELMNLLHLKDPPRKIECFDIAIFQGEAPTGSKVVLLDGIPLKEEYRYYHLELREEGNNDFLMLQEVLSRRMKEGNFPDIFLIDGGRPQLQAVDKILKEFGLEIPLLGIAKSRTSSDFEKSVVNQSEERLVLLNRKDPILLHNKRAILKLVTLLRDEAHRFARKLHHHKMKKNRSL